MTPDRPLPNPEQFPLGRIEPMYPRQIYSPKNNPDWIIEIKLNGFRAITYLTRDHQPQLVTSAGRDVYPAFPELHSGLTRLSRRHDLILDGEIVHGDGKTEKEMRVAVGRTNATPFTAHANSQALPCYYVAFDLLYLDGRDLTTYPLLERKKYLARFVNSTYEAGRIYRMPYLPTTQNLFRVAQNDHFEGVVYKNPKSIYLPGQTTDNWQKYKFKPN